MIITKAKQKKLAKDFQIYSEYQKLVSGDSRNMKSAVEDFLMEKYDISRVTI